MHVFFIKNIQYFDTDYSNVPQIEDSFNIDVQGNREKKLIVWKLIILKIWLYIVLLAQGGWTTWSPAITSNINHSVIPWLDPQEVLKFPVKSTYLKPTSKQKATKTPLKNSEALNQPKNPNQNNSVRYPNRTNIRVKLQD